MSLRLGIDTGGTFTDFVRLDGDTLTVHKLRSTPDDPSRAILSGISELTGSAFVDFVEIVHGSTVATNAVLERKGARVALVTTSGFEDVIRIARQTRPELYNLFVPPPRPIVDRGLTFGIRERLDASGNAITAVNSGETAELSKTLREQSIEMVAVCLLHSYANPDHERVVAEAFRKAGLRVSASHEVLPEYREYERWSTTIVNAYVTPLIDRYLETLQSRLTRSRLWIMQSNGGVISAASARAQAVRTVLSGPAAGVVGAKTVAGHAGFRRIISFDMGGTSTDVSLVDEAIATTNESKVGDFPVRLPVIDIHTVGAGGGSIARVDAGGALRVGPASAGADPGPACYGRGNDLTVTDANLLLGRLDPEFFLGGRMTLDAGRAQAAAAPLARALKLSVAEIAEGVVRVANANMERAIRVVSIERGHDPRAFTLVAFGGAGAMHACEIAQSLDVRTVLVPRHAGVLSALGMLASDVTRDYSASVLQPSDAISIADLEKRLSRLIAQARRDLRTEGFVGTRQQVIESRLDVRYVGQSYEITVAFGRDYRNEFDRRHRKLYGYANPKRLTEVVNIRVVASGITEKPSLPVMRRHSGARAKPSAVKKSLFGGRTIRTNFYRWDDLGPGMQGQGAAVITGGEATIVVPPRFRFRVDKHANVVIT